MLKQLRVLRRGIRLLEVFEHSSLYDTRTVVLIGSPLDRTRLFTYYLS